MACQAKQACKRLGACSHRPATDMVPPRLLDSAAPRRAAGGKIKSKAQPSGLRVTKHCSPQALHYSFTYFLSMCVQDLAGMDEEELMAEIVRLEGQAGAAAAPAGPAGENNRSTSRPASCRCGWGMWSYGLL